jgi:HlyD family secretion protein
MYKKEKERGQMKRIIGKIIKTVIILAIVGAVALGGYKLYMNSTAKDNTATKTSYTQASVTTGSLTQSVISTGSLSISDTATVKAPVDITIASVDVKVGETVAAGAALLGVDTSALSATIMDLTSQIATQDSSIISLASKYAVEKTLTAPIDSRVKAINIAKGQSLQEALDKNPALMILSLDGLMNVQIPASGVLALNAAVTVNGAGKNYTGTVARLSDGNAVITFPDTKVNIGETVQVLLAGAVIGSGTAQVNMPYQYGTTVSGLVDSVKATLNSYVYRNAALIYAVSVEATDEYNKAVKLRSELQAQLNAAKALLQDPVIRADKDGIISVINAAADSAVPADSALLTMYVGSNMEMVISVDELDIINVSVGQAASVIMDALPDASYDATVAYVSQIGTASSGITCYAVTLAVTGDSKVKLGMNGTATIHIGEQSNVLLIPLAAVQDDKEGSYVWKYDAAHVATDEEPGVKTYITTGLSNTDYAAVTRGLQLGDSVLVVRSAVASNSAVINNVPDFGNIGGGQMPADGTIPAPGTNRNNGTFGNGTYGNGTNGNGNGTYGNGTYGTRPGN